MMTPEELLNLLRKHHNKSKINFYTLLGQVISQEEYFLLSEQDRHKVKNVLLNMPSRKVEDIDFERINAENDLREFRKRYKNSKLE